MIIVERREHRGHGRDYWAPRTTAPLRSFPLPLALALMHEGTERRSRRRALYARDQVEVLTAALGWQATWRRQTAWRRRQLRDIARRITGAIAHMRRFYPLEAEDRGPHINTTEVTMRERWPAIRWRPTTPFAQVRIGEASHPGPSCLACSSP